MLTCNKIHKSPAVACSRVIGHASLAHYWVTSCGCSVPSVSLLLVSGLGAVVGYTLPLFRPSVSVSTCWCEGSPVLSGPVARVGGAASSRCRRVSTLVRWGGGSARRGCARWVKWKSMSSFWRAVREGGRAAGGSSSQGLRASHVLWDQCRPLWEGSITHSISQLHLTLHL